MTTQTFHLRKPIAPARSIGLRLDLVMETLIFAMIAFSALAFGAIDPWSEQIVVGGAGLLVLCFALHRLIRRDRPAAMSIAFLPIGLFMLLVLAQLLALPQWLIAHLSPGTSALWTRLQGEQTGPLSLSFYHFATLHDLRLLIAVVATFCVALNVFHDVKQVKRLLVAVTVFGGALAILALAQDLTEADKIYWTVDTVLDSVRGGPFVHYNHFSQFMNLTMGSSLALLLLELSGSRHTHHRTSRHHENQSAGVRAMQVWILSAILAVSATSIVLSLSRGGILSMFISFTIASGIAAMSGLGRARWLMVGLCGVVVAAVFVLGIDLAYNRLATVTHWSESYGGRWQIVKDILANWHLFPWLGTGLGTHEVVYPLFERSTATARFTHAENEYAQMLEEVGAVGLSLVLLFVVIIFTAYRRCLGRLARPGVRPIALGLGAGLLAIAIHSFSDFGQHLPANALLTSVYCAILVSLGRKTRSADPAFKNEKPTRRSSPIAGWAAVAATVCLAWTVVAMEPIRVAGATWQSAQSLAAQLEKQRWQGNDDDFQELLTQTQAAADLVPQNVQYQYQLNAYRWQTLTHELANQPESPQLSEDSIARVKFIVDELHHAQLSCPTYGLTYSLAGQLRAFVLDDPAGANEVRTAYLLASSDPPTAFCAGRLDASEGKWDQSLETFRHCRALGYPFAPMADVYVQQAHRPDLAVALAGDDPTNRLELAEQLKSLPAYQGIAQQLLATATVDRRAQLEAECNTPSATGTSLATLAQLNASENKDAAAIALYRRALSINYLESNWRLALAKSLAKTGQSQMALTEARVCLRQNPGMTEAREMIIRLTQVRPGDVESTGDKTPRADGHE